MGGTPPRQSQRYRSPKGLKFFDLAANLLLGPAQSLLNTPEHFIVLTLNVSQVVVREFGILLFEFTFDLIPTSFDLKFRHANRSQSELSLDGVYRAKLNVR
jgi:hypothetical protein